MWGDWPRKQRPHRHVSLHFPRAHRYGSDDAFSLRHDRGSLWYIRNTLPNELMAEYYAQRASAGSIITEGAQQMSELALGLVGCARQRFVVVRTINLWMNGTNSRNLQAAVWIPPNSRVKQSIVSNPVTIPMNNIITLPVDDKTSTYKYKYRYKYNCKYSEYYKLHLSICHQWGNGHACMIYFRPEINIKSASFVNACFTAMDTTSTFLVETLHGISFWNVATEDLPRTICTKQSVHGLNAFPPWRADQAQQKTLLEST